MLKTTFLRAKNGNSLFFNEKNQKKLQNSKTSSIIPHFDRFLG
jgi:queuine/archaeosine tRNA-ribosyltransferase